MPSLSRDLRNQLARVTLEAREVAERACRAALENLAENNLLHTSAEHGSVPVTLQECEELASELGAKDGFDLACKFAAEILPGVFRSDDPVFEVSLAQRDVVELRGLLDSLPSEVFTADDSLGWTYQFWQAKRKDEVNASGNKIGADVTADRGFSEVAIKR